MTRPSAGSRRAIPGARERGRLRHLATGLCLDIRGGRVVAGAGTGLAVCSSAATQQWSYEDDGLLRSLADPGLCLDSHSAAGEVFLSGCVGSRADEIRYDLTVQGELLPHWREELVVAPVSLRAGAGVVVRTRSGAVGEKCTLDSDPAASDDSAGTDDRQKDVGAKGAKGAKDPKSGEPDQKDQKEQKGEGAAGGTQHAAEPGAGNGAPGPPGRPHPHPRSRPRPTPDRPAVRDAVRRGRRRRGARARSGDGPAAAAADRGAAGRRHGGARSRLAHGDRRFAPLQVTGTRHRQPRVSP